VCTSYTVPLIVSEDINYPLVDICTLQRLGVHILHRVTNKKLPENVSGNVFFNFTSHVHSLMCLKLSHKFKGWYTLSGAAEPRDPGGQLTTHFSSTWSTCIV